MQRLTLTPRPDKASKLEAIGLSFHAWDDYWNEAACYRFSAAQVDELEEATEALHTMCLQAVDHVITQGRLGQLGWLVIQVGGLDCGGQVGYARAETNFQDTAVESCVRGLRV